MLKEMCNEENGIRKENLINKKDEEEEITINEFKWESL